MSETLSINEKDLEEDRFSRFDLLHWWDRDKMANANVLVVGAGALGNEILKNLALLGFRRVVVIDMDDIEASNLSRSVLFRPENLGQPKAATAAKAARSIYEDMVVEPLHANILHEVGLGLFGWADVILGGLDNREARLWINRCAWKMNRPWIDGAIEGLNGVVRTFLPGRPPCYECTLGETDWAILEKRLSCAMLTREQMESGKTPTTPTSSSVIAGMQVQEAVKHIHGLPILDGKGFVFEGLNHTSYVVSYTENHDCMSHETYEAIIELPLPSSELTLDDLLARAQQDLETEQVELNFSRDIIHKLSCPNCGQEDILFRPMGTVSTSEGTCAHCPESPNRIVHRIHKYSGREDFGKRNLDRLGLPVFDVYVARSMERETAYLIAGDRKVVLGPLA